MTVTLKDIAQRAGISISTVSRIVNNDQNKSASKKTTEKVWALVRELGYIPNADARNLIKNTKSDLPQLNKTIGCILTSQKDTFRDPFFSQIMMFNRYTGSFVCIANHLVKISTYPIEPRIYKILHVIL